MDNEKLKQQFGLISKQYDSHRRCFIPCFNDFYTNSLSVVKKYKEVANNIMDLGAGTGLLTQEMYLLYPNAKFKLIDLSDEMLEVAKRRFEGLENFEFITSDYSQTISNSCDIICSALSIHHLDNDAKFQLFKNIYNALPKGGCFINLDQHCSKSEVINKMYNSWWIDYINNSGITIQQKEAWLERQKLDKEISIKDEIEMLEGAGFEFTDCIYSFMKFGTTVSIKR